MTTTYQGGCHCGAVRYEVSTELTKVATCNCSICSKAGWSLAFTPADQFTLKSGAENLTDYQFGKKQIHHVFCKTCGIRSFSRGAGPDGKEYVAVNARCLDGVNLEGIETSMFDGKSL